MSNNSFQLVSHSKSKCKGCDEVDEGNIVTEKCQHIASAKLQESGDNVQHQPCINVASSNRFNVLSDTEGISDNNDSDSDE